MEQTGKLLNRKITPENNPPILLSYRNADLMQEKKHYRKSFIHI